MSCYILTYVQRVNLGPLLIDIWYNKWAGGDREDSYSKFVAPFFLMALCIDTIPAKPNRKRGVISSETQGLRELIPQE